MKRSLRSLVVLVACLSALSTVTAEVVFMRDGSRIEGEILSQTRTEVRIRVGSDVRTISKDRIVRIQYREGKEPKTDSKATESKARAEEERRKREEAEREQKARERREMERRRLTSGQLVWRSAVLPGWGQFASGHPVKGSAAAVLVVGGLAGGVSSRRQAVAAVEKYERSARRNFLLLIPAGADLRPLLFVWGVERNRVRYKEAADHRRNMAFGFSTAALAYAWQIVNAYATGRRDRAASAPALEFAWSGNSPGAPSMEGRRADSEMFLSIRFRF